jgi:hypothetical protein
MGKETERESPLLFYIGFAYGIYAGYSIVVLFIMMKTWDPEGPRLRKVMIQRSNKCLTVEVSSSWKAKIPHLWYG